MAGRTYRFLADSGFEFIINIKTAWAFDGKRGGTPLGDKGEKYEINEESIFSFPYGSFGKATYTVSADKTTLTPTEDIGAGYDYVLTLVTETAAE